MCRFSRFDGGWEHFKHQFYSNRTENTINAGLDQFGLGVNRTPKSGRRVTVGAGLWLHRRSVVPEMSKTNPASAVHRVGIRSEIDERFLIESAAFVLSVIHSIPSIPSPHQTKAYGVRLVLRHEITNPKCLRHVYPI
jgi:hypothetical protein